jgi:hypothetical protein
MGEQTERERIAILANTCAGINLRRAARAITNHYDHYLSRLSGCATQIPLLVVLYLAGLTIQEIAGKLELTRQLPAISNSGEPACTPARQGPAPAW